MIIRRWKPLTLLKYGQKLESLEQFCTENEYDLTPDNTDDVLLEFVDRNIPRLACSTIRSELAGIKTILTEIMGWSISTKFTDKYLEGYKKSTDNRPTTYLASRISEKELEKIREICCTSSNSRQRMLALVSWIQCDLIARISNIVGQYGLRFDSFLDSSKLPIVKTKSQTKFIVLTGSKTRVQNHRRILEVHDKRLVPYIDRYVQSQFKGTLDAKVFSLSTWQLNAFLDTAINSTSHAFRSLGARMYEKRFSRQEAMARGDWRTLAAYSRYVQS